MNTTQVTCLQNTSPIAPFEPRKSAFIVWSLLFGALRRVFLQSTLIAWEKWMVAPIPSFLDMTSASCPIGNGFAMARIAVVGTSMATFWAAVTWCVKASGLY